MSRQTLIADRLAEARARKGWTQVDLASASGVAAGQIARYEMGQQPRLTTLAKLADALDVSMGWLRGDDGQSEQPKPQFVVLHVPLSIAADECLRRQAFMVGLSAEGLAARWITERANEGVGS